MQIWSQEVLTAKLGEKGEGRRHTNVRGKSTPSRGKRSQYNAGTCLGYLSKAKVAGAE